MWSMDGENDGKTSTLSTEQLLDYIKKQKVRIKRLEKDKEGIEQALSAATSGRLNSESATRIDQTLFWDLISREQPFSQNLARSAINSLVSAISRSGLAKNSIPSKRSLFDLWKDSYLRCKASQGLKTAIIIFNRLLACSNTLNLNLLAERHAEDVTKAMAASEQKASKLKALLARTHQANQRYQEDTTTFKKAQKEAVMQLKTLKEKDETERTALLEAVRVQSIETAFQYDVEIAIQRAAEDMIMQQQQMQSQSQQLSTAKRISSLEEDLGLAQQRLADSDQLVAIKSKEVERLSGRVASLEGEVSRLRELSLSLEGQIRGLDRQLDDEARVRRELEVELDITVRNRNDVLRELEAAAELRIERQAERCAAEVASMKAAMHFTEHNLEKSLAEAAALRAANRTLVDASIEVVQLRATVAELKRATSTSSSLGFSTSSAATASATSNPHDRKDSVDGSSHNQSHAAYEPILTELVNVSRMALKHGIAFSDKYADSNKTISQLLREHVRREGLAREALRRQLRPDGSGDAPLPVPRRVAGSLLLFFFRRLAVFSRDGSLFGDMVDSLSGPFVSLLRDVLRSVVDAEDARGRAIFAKRNSLSAKLAVCEKEMTAIQERRQQVAAPMIWEASAMAIPAGKDVAIVIPVLKTHTEHAADGSLRQELVPRQANKGVLEWRFTGELAASVALSIGRLGVAGDVSVPLPSTRESASEYGGHCEILQSDGDRVLRLNNTSVWGSARINYLVRSSFGGEQQLRVLEDALDRTSRQMASLHTAQAAYEAAVEEGHDLLLRLRRLLTAIADCNQSASDQALTNESDQDSSNDEERASFNEALQSSEKTSTELRWVSSSLMRRLDSLIGEAREKGLSLGDVSEDTSDMASPISHSDRAGGGSNSGGLLAEPPLPADSKITTYSCESMKIKAADDFRLQIPAPCDTRVRLAWDFELLLAGRSHSSSNNNGNGNNNGNVKEEVSKAPRPGPRNTTDVGFAILEKRADGSLPQIVSYRRVRAPGLKGEVIVDVAPSTSTSQATAAPSTDGGNESSSPSPSQHAADNYFVILFDNSYSWYNTKEIKYNIVVEVAPGGAELSDPLSLEYRLRGGRGGAGAGGADPAQSSTDASAAQSLGGADPSTGTGTDTGSGYFYFSAAHISELHRLLDDVAEFWARQRTVLSE